MHKKKKKQKNKQTFSYNFRKQYICSPGCLLRKKQWNKNNKRHSKEIVVQSST